MKIQTGVSVNQFLNDIAVEVTGLSYDQLLKVDAQAAKEIRYEAEINTAEWERVLYFN